MDLKEQNKEIDKIFRKIETIAAEYLECIYPEAPDPDEYIDRIENQIKKYQKLTGEID